MKGVVVGELGWRLQAEEAGFDRMPGMPLAGFLAGTVLSVTLWALVGLAVWQLF